MYFLQSSHKLDRITISRKKKLAFFFGVSIIEFVNIRKEFYNEQRRISTRNC